MGPGRPESVKLSYGGGASGAGSVNSGGGGGAGALQTKGGSQFNVDGASGGSGTSTTSYARIYKID